MATTGIPKARLASELKKLRNDPPDGVCCWPRHGSPSPTDSDAAFTFDQDGGFLLDISMTGPAGTPYQDGIFQLACRLPPNYPVAPPHIRFLTRVYHPNMDSHGRICIPVLKEGTEPDRWNPVKCNIRSALAQIRQLLAEPNPDDPLDAEAARLMVTDAVSFQRTAREHTKLYATGDQSRAAAGTMSGPVSSSSASGTTTSTADDASSASSILGAVAAGPVRPTATSISIGGSTSSLLKGPTLKLGLTSSGSKGLMGGMRAFGSSSAGAGRSSILGGSNATTSAFHGKPASAEQPVAAPSTVYASAAAAPSTTGPAAPSSNSNSAKTDSTNPSSKRSRDPEPLPASSSPPRPPTPTDNPHPSKKARQSNDLPTSSSRIPTASINKENKSSSASPPPSPPRLAPQVQIKQPADVVDVTSSSSSPVPPPPATATSAIAPAPAAQTLAPTTPALAGPVSARTVGPSLLSGTSNAPARTSSLGGGGGLLGSAPGTRPATGGLLSGRGGNAAGTGLFGANKAAGNGNGTGGGLFGRASALGAASGAGAPRTGLLGKGGLLGAAKQAGAGGSIFGGKSGLFSKKPSG